MKPLYLTKLIAVVAILFTCNWDAFSQSTTYAIPGGPFPYTVPIGVTAIGVDMQGGAGGNEYFGPGVGGAGGRVQCTMAVTAGQTYYVFVAGKGQAGTTSYVSNPGGTNGGGPSTAMIYGGTGGGASDIRTITGAYASGPGLASRLVVAGGGGGAGLYCECTTDLGGAGGGITGGNGTAYGSYYAGYMGAGGGQTQLANGNTYGGATTYEGTLGVGGTSYCCDWYGGTGGGGYYGGGGAYLEGSGGGGSSYPAANGGQISNLTHTQGYNLSSTSTTGNGIVVICAPNVGTISGNNPVCVGAVMPLSGSGSGGTWSSSSTGVATVDASGNVTGVSAGNATITYAVNVAGCGAGFVTAAVTVNPAPTAILGSTNICNGFTTTLSDAGGGTWASSAAGVATIGASTGFVTGVSAGATNITYTLPTGCRIVTPFVVNPIPNFITGPNNVCAAGGAITLGDANPGGSWTSSNTAVATVTSSTGIVTGAAAGATIITYTLPTTCLITATITTNPLPSLITGATSVCTGSTTALSDAGGGTWSSNNVAVASVGASGVVSGVAAGSATIKYTLPTGCSITNPMLVNALPNAITGTASVCAGLATSFSDVTTGGIWSISNPAIASIVPTSGSVSTVSSGIPNVTYTLPTTCFVTTPLTINALPNAFTVTGGGNYCIGTAGVHIGLSLSTTGVDYKLFNGGTLVTTAHGLNTTLDFGAVTTNGTYTVVGVNTGTGCINNMAGSTTVLTNPLPNTYNVTGGGNFCPGSAGAHVYLSGTDAGVNYQLMAGTTATGSIVTGTGGGTTVDFGLQTTPGIYTVQATNPTTGCQATMVGSASLIVNPQPAFHNVTGGGGYCTGGAGVPVSLDGSDASISYQLFHDGVSSGSSVAGTGGIISFGLQTGAGAYNVSATNTLTGCTDNMLGNANVNLEPLPVVYFVTGGGSYCPGGPGVHVNLNLSSTGVNYQLYLGASAIGGPVGGSGAGLDMGLIGVAGSYSIIGTDAGTGCSSNMSGSATVSVSSLPTAHNVTGGGGYCAGGVGVRVGLDASNAGTRYQLMYGSTLIGSPLAGTGGALNFGLQSTTGVYTVVASSVTTSCTSNMTGSATVSLNSLPSVDTVVGAGTSYCAGGGGIDIMLNSSDPSTTYQLYRGGARAGATMPGTGSSIDFGSQMLAGNYTVLGVSTSTGCSSTQAGSANITINPAPASYAVIGGGSYCAGGTGVHISLAGSTIGITYMLMNGATTAATMTGAGSAVDFGAQAGSGSYTVTAMDPITGCSSNMSGTRMININMLPLAYTIMGGANYCAGGAGVPLSLSGSEAATHYQLFNGSTPAGAYATGTGGMVSFGTESAGNYTVVATNPVTGCSAPMTGMSTVGINAAPAAQTVMGGGPYCSTGSGADIMLGGSVMGVNYMVMHGGVALTTTGGTGAPLDLGLYPGAGSYTVVARDTTTTCTSNMTGSATVSITLQPSAETVMGGGSFCAGGTGVGVSLSGSNAGIQYQLLKDGSAVGGLMTGTGGVVNFGSQTLGGSYTVIASPGGLCQTTMTGSKTITVSAQPTAYTVTGGGSFCSNTTGADITLTGSSAGVNYKLYKGTVAEGMFAGTGSAIDFGAQTISGIYTVKAVDTITGCAAIMTGSGNVNMVPAPTVFDVRGGGPYCEGGAGSNVMLGGSATDVFYTLWQNGVSLGDSMAGTGTILDFGPQATAANYTISARDAATGCTAKMVDTATVSVSPIVTPSITLLTSTDGLTIKMNEKDSIKATVANGGTDGAMYQWYINSFPIVGATGANYVSSQFHNGDTVLCVVTSTGMCGGQTARKSLILTVLNTEYVNTVTAGSSDVKVIPNPNNGAFTVSGSIGVNSDEEVTLEVTDMLGHVVYTNKVMTSNGTINEHVAVSGLANGAYLLSLRSNSLNQVFHVVIEQ